MSGPRTGEIVIGENARLWHFEGPADPDAILDAITDEQYDRDQFLPYWSEIWPSSQVLFSYLAKRPFRRAQKACELGCGLGILSALLAARGLKTISMDIAPPACTFALRNIRRYAKQALVLCGDWRQSPFRTGFELIIGADILYESRWIAPVLAFLKTHLHQHGEAIIADPRRAHWEPFKTAAQASGFIIDIAQTEAINAGKTVIEIACLRINNQAPFSRH